MANAINIESTTFNSTTKSYGYRMYDDYDKTYCNMWDSIPENDLEILEKVISEKKRR